MTKYKVGDKVKIRSWESMAKEFGVDLSGDIKCKNFFTRHMRKYCGKTFTIKEAYKKHDDVDCYRFDDIDCFVFSNDMFENKTVQQKILIMTDGVTTTAKLLDGKQVIKTAEAKCFSGDKFDFNLGATIALSRLTGLEKKSSLLNTRICITDGDDVFKTGQIYDVVDGKIKQRNGMIIPVGFELATIEELYDYFSPTERRKCHDGFGWSNCEIKFVEVKE